MIAPLDEMAAHETIADLDLGPDPLTIPLIWADGTPFRVTVYSQSQWNALPAAERPQAWLDDTGRAYVALTAAP